MSWSWKVETSSDERADRRVLEAIQSGHGEWSETPRPLTRNQLKKLFDAGEIHRGGKPLKPSEALHAGDRVDLVLPPLRPMEIVPEDRPVEVLFEDEYLLVINKAAGISVHPSETEREGTLVHALLHHVRDLSGIGGVLRPGIVHRIDKWTSGALVVSKDDTTHLGLTALFAKHDIEREYHALVYGSPAWVGEHRVETLLGRHPVDRKKMSVDVKEGRRAVSWFERIESYGVQGKHPFAALVRAHLETGRTHQVRVHLTHLQHSILGDPTYGKPTVNQPKWKALPQSIQSLVSAMPGQALHARVLGFTHPRTGKRVRVEAPAPRAFEALLEGLRAFQK